MARFFTGLEPGFRLLVFLILKGQADKHLILACGRGLFRGFGNGKYSLFLFSRGLGDELLDPESE